MSRNLVAGVDFPSRQPPPAPMTGDELRFYGPIPSAISRCILLMFWPTVLLAACLYWWLG